MYKKFLVISCFIFILFHVEALEIKAVSDIWAPYIIDLSSNKEKGYLVELLKEIAKRVDVKIIFEKHSYVKSISLVEEGKADILIGCTKIEDKKIKMVNVPLAKIHYSFYTVTGSKWKYDGIQSLKKVKLGIIKGYGYGPLEAYAKSNKSNIKEFSSATPLLDSIKALFKGDIDTFAQDVAATNYTLNNKFHNKKLRKAGNLRGKGKIYFCVSEVSDKSNTILDLLTKEIELMKNEKVIKKLREKYYIVE